MDALTRDAAILRQAINDVRPFLPADLAANLAWQADRLIETAKEAAA